MFTIAEVIGWKFNNQPGMRCAQNADGTMYIVEFPGGVPTQADQTRWMEEYAAYVSSGAKSTVDTTICVDGNKALKASIIWIAGQLNLPVEQVRSEIISIYETL